MPLLTTLLILTLPLTWAAAESDCDPAGASLGSDLSQLVDPLTGDVYQIGDSVPVPDDHGEPGSKLVILSDYKPTIERTRASWGPSLNDISSHEPNIVINGRRVDYTDADYVTHGHEMSHGIHSRLRINTTERDNGFYLLNDQYVLIREPDTTISQTAAFVPSVLRNNSRYRTYIAPTSQLVRSWDDTPLYTWDEWVAYTNGGTVGVEMAEMGLWDQGGRDAVAGVYEFSVWAIAVAMSVQKNDPESWEENTQIREFLAYNLERAMDVYERGLKVPAFVGSAVPTVEIGEGASRRTVPKDLYGMWKFRDDFLTDPSAAPMREWLRETYGPAWTARTMGF